VLAPTPILLEDWFFHKQHFFFFFFPFLLVVVIFDGYVAFFYNLTFAVLHRTIKLKIL